MGIQQSMGYGFGRFLDLEIDAAGLGDAGGGGLGEPAGGAQPDPGAGAAPDPYGDRFAQYDQRFGGLESQLGQIAQLLQQGQQPAAPAAPAAPELPEWDPWDPNVVAAYQAHAVQQAIAPLLEQLAPIQEITASTAAERATEIANRELEARASQVGSFDLETGRFLAEALVTAHGMDDGPAFDLVAQHLAGYEKRIREEAGAQAVEAFKAQLAGSAGEALNGQPAFSEGGVPSAARIEEVPSGESRYSDVLARWRQTRAARPAGS